MKELRFPFLLMTVSTLLSVIAEAGDDWLFASFLWAATVLPICVFVANEWLRD